MSINLTDEIDVKTKKGKLCAAKQIFLEGDTQTVEKEIQDINSRHNTLNTKHESLSRTVQGISVTGGASTANNVTYNNDISGLNAENAQDAIDELQNSKFDKTSILQESGDAEDKVMSQKVTTTAIADEVARAKAAEEAIIFDVSANNNDAVFKSLSALLNSSDLSILIPTSVRHGGMTIRFIQSYEQSSDNKYVQYRYMEADATTAATFINVANWQGIDEIPTPRSQNLMTSGGVYSAINGGGKAYRPCTFSQQNNKILEIDGTVRVFSNWAVTDYIDIKNFYGIRFYASQFPEAPYVSIQLYDEQKNIVKNLISIPTEYEILNNQYSYARVCFHISSSSVLNVYEIYLSGGIGKIVQQIEDINNSIEDINNSIEDINSKIENISEPIQYELTPIRAINQDGSITNHISSAWGVSDLIQVKQGEKYSVFATQFPEAPHVGIQVLDNDASTVIKNYIKGTDLIDGQSKDVIIEHDGYLRVGVRISEGYEHSIIMFRTLSETVEYLLHLAQDNKIAIDKNINFVGMSIWWYDGKQLDSGHVGGEIAEGYQTLLKRQFAFLSDTGTNYCYSGQSLGAISGDDTSCIMNHADTWNKSENAIWTLDTITNDFKRNIPIGSYSDYTNKTGITTYYGALREFADKLNALSGNDVIVICSNALRRNNSGYTSTSQNTQGHRLVDYEHALMDIATRNHWYFVDQFRLCGVTDDSIDLTTIDGLHLNNFGYTLAVKPWIEQFNIIARTLSNALL